MSSAREASLQLCTFLREKSTSQTVLSPHLEAILRTASGCVSILLEGRPHGASSLIIGPTVQIVLLAVQGGLPAGDRGLWMEVAFWAIKTFPLVSFWGVLGGKLGGFGGRSGGR